MILLYMVMESQSTYTLVNMGLILDTFEVGSKMVSITCVCIGGFSGAFFHGYIVKRLKMERKFRFIMILDTVLSSILCSFTSVCLYM